MKRLTLLLLALFVCVSAQAGKKSEFRAYKANKLKQQDKIWLTRAARKPGCHNLVIKLMIYRVAQIGFDHCVIYSNRGCEAGSEIPVRWKNEKDPTTTITQGARWFLPGDRGSDMGSWKCVATGNDKPDAASQ